MFYKVMKGWAHIGRQITSVAGDDQIDDIMRLTCGSKWICEWDFLPVFDPVNS